MTSSLYKMLYVGLAVIPLLKYTGILRNYQCCDIYFIIIIVIVNFDILLIKYFGGFSD